MQPQQLKRLQKTRKQTLLWKSSIARLKLRLKTITENMKKKRHMIITVTAQVVSSTSLRLLLTSTTGLSIFLTTFIVIVQLKLMTWQIYIREKYRKFMYLLGNRSKERLWWIPVTLWDCACRSTTLHKSIYQEIRPLQRLEDNQGPIQLHMSSLIPLNPTRQILQHLQAIRTMRAMRVIAFSTIQGAVHTKK